MSFHSYFRQYDAHGYVLVSTDNFSTADTVYEASWYHGYNNAGPRDEVVKLNISAAAGGSTTVKVRFIFMDQGNWTPSGYYFWMIDDVKVEGASDWDMSIEDVFYQGAGSFAIHYQYGNYYRTIPESQATSADLTFGVALRSLSNSVNSNAHLEATVSGGSTFSGTSPNVDYSVFNSVDTVDLTTTFTPDGMGMHYVDFTVQGDSTDDFPGDNSQTRLFEVTEQLQGWDGGFVGGAVYWGSGVGYGIFQRFDVYAADTLLGIEFGIFSSTSFPSDDGAAVQAGVWKVTGGKIAGSGDVDLTQPEVSDFMVLTSDMYTDYSDSNKVIRLTFDDPFPIDTGEYLVGWIGQSGNSKTPMSNRPNGAVNAFLSSDGSQIDGWIDYNPLIHMVYYDGNVCDDVTLKWKLL